ncbi:MAG: sulfurtransferase [Candidatus Melainabacteria bacterium]|nr:sulfurtransferase [Candidatus Melainabacteria bacterium]
MTVPSHSTRTDATFTNSTLISASELAEALRQPNPPKLLDATYFLPPDDQNREDAYHHTHLPGALFFDIDAIADHSSALPHMLPDATSFAEAMTRLGIENGDWLVIYDRNHNAGACRAWWMLKSYGHVWVSVLDGGLTAWQQAGLPVEHTPVTPTVSNPPYLATLQPDWVKDLPTMLANLETAGFRILDARSAQRFEGEAPEPRPGLQSGHIPGSQNLPWQSLICAESHQFLPEATLRERLSAVAPDRAQPLVTSCGSGLTACLLAFTLDRLGYASVAVYDGSWAEWGCEPNRPIETGPAKASFATAPA